MKTPRHTPEPDDPKKPKPILPAPVKSELQQLSPEEMRAAHAANDPGPRGAAQPEGLEAFEAAELPEELALADERRDWEQVKQEIEQLCEKKEGDWRSLVKKKIETLEGQISERRASLGSGKSEAYRRSAFSEIEKLEAWIASLRSDLRL